MTMFKDRPVLASVISSYMRSKGEGLFVTRTVGELLWGYQDGLLTALKILQPQLDDVFGLFYKVFTVTLSSARRSEKIKSYWLIFLSPHRAMLPTMANTFSSPANKTPQILPEWTHGTMRGKCPHSDCCCCCCTSSGSLITFRVERLV